MVERRQINLEELGILYQLIGEGVWQLQNLEDALHSCITVKRDLKTRGSVSSQEAMLLLEKNRAQVLGKSVKYAKEAGIFNQKLQDRLEKFKEERNWLIHRSVHEKREDLYVDKTRFSLMERIKRFSNEALQLQKLVAQELEDFVLSQGISKEYVYQKALEKLKALKGI